MQSMLFYALLVVVLFSLAFDPTRETSRQYAGGVMCVAVLFAAVQALNQAWSRELRGNVLDAQRMSPAPASASSTLPRSSRPGLVQRLYRGKQHCDAHRARLRTVATSPAVGSKASEKSTTTSSA